MLESVKINNKVLEVPIIQGGMGVGVSLSNLAGNVMKCGGMGVISAAHPGYKKENFNNDSLNVNREAIVEEINKAREISGGRGLLGVNIMVAMKDYDELVRKVVEAKADAIISGAGLPLNLPKLVDNDDILLAPIVSSGKAMKLVLSAWDRHYSKTPDFVVIEGSKAGGHLGFKKEELLDGTCQSLEEIYKDVELELKEYRTKYNKDIPIFVAGGIYNGDDIAHFIKLGASGVQMGTRFIATHECDADIKFKEAIVNSKKEDIEIVKSPTGFPGRAIMNDFMKKVMSRDNISMLKCFDCLKPCNPKDTPYCISQALIQAVKGNLEKGLIFVGSNAYLVDKIVSVKELMDELINSANKKLAEVL